MEPLHAFHHVSLTVRDLDVSAVWYRDVLGLEELFREDGDRRRAVVLGFAGGGFSVGLVEHGEPGGSFDPTHLGLDHVAFTVRTRGELDAWAARLDEAGIDHSGAIDVPPGAILNLRDPDGIALALFWDRREVSGAGA